ncbi:MAG: hypothetical protein ACJ75R_01405, partial [Solirubrobacterales bacterium]
MDVYQRRRLVALSALAGVFIIIVLLIKSCGGDSNDATTTAALGASGTAGATSLSQADYIAQGDDICRQTNTSISQIDASDANAAASEKGTDIASELNALQTLPAPTDGQDQLDGFLQALQDQVDDYEKRDVAVERGDDSAVAEIDAKIADDEDTAKSAAQKFGFEACGDFSQTSKTGGGGGGGGGGPETTTTTSATGGTIIPTTTIPPTTTTVPTTTPPATGAPPAGGTGTTPPAGGTGGAGTGGTGGVTPWPENLDASRAGQLRC